jgi:phosphate/sulfate permease
MSELYEAFRHLEPHREIILAVALIIAFGFEVVNGFHDTANAVTTVIYTRTLRPVPAVLFSGLCNFLGVLLGGTAIAFSIVRLLPVDLLMSATSRSALIMVLALLTAGMAWNLSTWWLGLPVSSSHTLIGAILGIGLANSLLEVRGLSGGVNWAKAGEVGLSLLISPLIGFISAVILFLTLKRLLPDPELYVPPPADESARPPRWVRAVLVTTCGGVSIAHGSNDGQKGMGLIMLVLIGLVPAVYALNLKEASGARDALAAAEQLKVRLTSYHGPSSPDVVRELESIITDLDGKVSLREVPAEERWKVRSRIFQLNQLLERRGSKASASEYEDLDRPRRELRHAIEYVPTWVVVGVALSLGIGTTIGYRRIVVTVAEKIGKAHLTYAQGATAEVVAMATIGLADVAGLPVSTTQVLSSGVAGTMWANQSGIQSRTIRNIGLAWILTLPAAMLMSALLFTFGRLALGS